MRICSSIFALFFSVCLCPGHAGPGQTEENPCARAKSERALGKLPLNTSGIESCFTSVKKLLQEKKTRVMGIHLLSEFMYIYEEEYRSEAIMELGMSKSVLAIKYLTEKGMRSINEENRDEIELVVGALINLDGHAAARSLALYAGRHGKPEMKTVVGYEYLFYTSGEQYQKMEAIIGKVID